MVTTQSSMIFTETQFDTIQSSRSLFMESLHQNLIIEQTQQNNKDNSNVLYKFQKKKSGMILRQSNINHDNRYQTFVTKLSQIFYKKAWSKLIRRANHPQVQNSQNIKKPSLVYAIINRLPQKFKNQMTKIIDSYQSEILQSTKIIHELESKYNELKNKKSNRRNSSLDIKTYYERKDSKIQNTKNKYQEYQNTIFKNKIKQLQKQIKEKNQVIINLKKQSSTECTTAEIESSKQQEQQISINTQLSQLRQENSNLHFQIDNLKEEIKQMCSRQQQFNTSKYHMINDYSNLESKLQNLQQKISLLNNQNLRLKQQNLYHINQYISKIKYLESSYDNISNELQTKQNQLDLIMEVNTELEHRFQKFQLKYQNVEMELNLAREKVQQLKSLNMHMHQINKKLAEELKVDNTKYKYSFSNLTSFSNFTNEQLQEIFSPIMTPTTADDHNNVLTTKSLFRDISDFTYENSNDSRKKSFKNFMNKAKESCYTNVSIERKQDHSQYEFKQNLEPEKKRLRALLKYKPKNLSRRS